MGGTSSQSRVSRAPRFSQVPYANIVSEGEVRVGKEPLLPVCLLFLEDRCCFSTTGRTQPALSCRIVQMSQGAQYNKRKRGHSGSEEEDTTSSNRVGLEAMLYNVHTLGVFQRMLDDPVTKTSVFRHFMQFIA